MNFLPGQIVKHFKRDLINHNDDDLIYLYEIVGEVIHSETNEKMMCYRALYGDRKMYIRPINSFYSKVDNIKYPNAKQKYRFELLSKEE